jgi:PAS domain S-box-containing protein
MISILYVDDEPDLLDLAQVFLEQSGEFRVRISTSPEGILGTPDITSFDAILSDYQMPGMDGIAFLKEIRKLSPDLPFILFTGRGREEIVIEALNNGADFYIQKGGDPRAQFAELANKIRYAVNRRRTELELRRKSDELNASYEQIAANEEELRQQLDELTAKQEALKISEEKFRAFTENVPDLTTITDVNGNYLYISPSIQRITGLDADALLGKKYAGVSASFGIVPEDAEIILASGRSATKKPGEPVPVPPFRVRDVQGKSVFIEGTITYLPDVKGIQGLLFHGRNITDRVNAEEEIDRKNQELRMSYEQLTASEEELRGQYEELAYGQKRIRESEEKFRSLFEKTQDALVLFGRDGCIDCNQQALQLFGYPAKEDFLGILPVDVSPPTQPDGTETAVAVESHIRTVLEKGVDHFEWLHKRKDQSTFLADILLSAFSLEGHPVFLSSVRDITERKRLEDELRVLKISVDRSSDEVFWLDFDASIRYVNDAACRVTGYSHDELCAMKISELDPGVTPEIWENIVTSLRSNKTLYFTTRHRRRDGTFMDVEIVAVYVNKDNQEYSFAFVRDITERKIAERKILDNTAFLNALIEQNPNSMWISDDKGFLIRMNAACRRLLNSTEEELVGRYNIFQDNIVEQQGFMPLVRSVFDEGKTVHFSLVYDSSRLSTVPLKEAVSVLLDVTIFPVRNADGKIANAVVVHNDVSDRARAERTLAESEERYRLLVETTSDFIWEVDTEGKYTYISPKIRDILGFEPEEIIGKTPFDLMIPDDTSRIAAEFSDYVKREAAFSGLVNANRHKNGSTVILETSAAPFFSHDGTFAGYRGIDRDITKRKKAEDALFSSQQMLQTVLDTIPQRVFWKDKNSVFLGCNKSNAADAGFSDPAQMVGKTDYDYTTTEVAELYRADDRLVMQTGQGRINYEEPQVRPDGSKAWLRTSKVPLRDKEGNVAGVLGTYEDITEYKRSQEELRESEERYRTLIDTSFDGIAIHQDGTLVFVNQTGARLLGADDPAHLVGKRALEVVHPDDRALIAERIRVSPEKTLDLLHERFLRADGSTVDVDVASSPCTWQGRPATYVTFRDISAQKRVQDALRENEENYRSLIEFAPVAIVVHRNGVNVYANPEAVHLVKAKSTEDIVGKDILTFVSPEHRERTLDAAKMMTEENRPLPRQEQHIVALDGEVLTVEIVAKPISFQGLPSIMVLMRDITQRKKAEEELFGSQQMLQSVLDTIPQRVFWKDRNSVYIGCNKALARDAGLSDPSELIGKTDYDNAFRKTADLYRADDQQVMESGLSRINYEEAQVRSDGSNAWLRTSKVPLRDKEGNVVGVLGTYEDITEYKRSQEALRESEEQYRTLVENANEAIAIVQEWRIVFVNKRGAEFLGRPVQDIEGRQFVDFIWPEDRERITDLHGKRIAGEPTPQMYDFRIVGAGGRPVWVSNSTTGITWKGKPAALSLMTDITERKFAEAALKESEETFRKVIEGAPEAIYISADWKFQYLNPAALRLFGATSGNQLIGTPFLDRIHKKFHDTIKKRVTGLYDDLVTATALEEVYLRLDGTEIEVEVSAVPFEYQGKNAALIFVWNISDRKKAEQARRESEEEYRRILDNMQDAYIRTGRDGRIIMVNPSATRMFGYGSPPDMIGLPIESLYRDPLRREVVMKKMQEEGKISDSAEMMRHRDGTSFWASLNIQFARGGDGTISGAEGIVRDITERKVMEQAIQDTNRKLSLLNSITRHDVANQLTVLRGYAQLVELSNTDPVIIDFMQKIEKSADTITSQIEFTKEYQELGAHTPAWFGLEEILEKTARPEVSFSKTCLATEIFADPMIERVFFNLFDNAIRHGEHVTTIGIRCERAPDGLVIIVEDDGVGIAPEEKEKIFEKAYGKNTGFGLFLAREILAITGITIRETGYLGVGARFEITVPKEQWRTTAGQ